MEQDEYTPFFSLRTKKQADFDVTPEQEDSIWRTMHNDELLSPEQVLILDMMEKRSVEKKLKTLEEQGIVQQVLVDHVCRTTPKHVENIIKQAYPRLQQEKPDLAERFVIENWLFELTSEIRLSILGPYPNIDIGAIVVTPVNDIESRIEIICSGDLTKIMYFVDPMPVYQLSLSVLQFMANELRQLFNIPIESRKDNTSDVLVQSQPPTGRPSFNYYNASYSYVQKYITEQGKPDSKAIRMAYSYCLESGLLEEGKVDFEMFRSAMKSRLKKWRQRI